MISCIIPTYKDEPYLTKCLASVRTAIGRCPEAVEILLRPNTPDVGKLKTCNKAALEAKGDILVFLDADCIVSENFFAEISRKANNFLFAGGGVKWVRLERMSLGIGLWALCLLCVLFALRITAGAFWVRKSVWKKMGGFRDKYKYYDLDFAVRLRRFAKSQGMEFESLKECFLIWSTRKFDWFGDWHWLTGYKAEWRGYEISP